jgi:hypothetical protein
MRNGNRSIITTLGMADGRDAHGHGDDALIVQEGACDTRSSLDVCMTNWFRGGGGNLRQRAPEAAPCADELSAHVMKGMLQLDGIYSSEPFDLNTTDVVNNDLGVIAGFRGVVGTRVGVSDETVLTQAIAATNTFTKAAGLNPCVGIHITVALAISSAQAPVNVIFSTTGLQAAFGAALVNRSVAIQLKRLSATMEFFLPTAAINVGTNTWAPVLGLANSVTPSTVVLTGLGGLTGTATARFVGPSSAVLPRIFGAMLNAVP